MIEFSPEFQMFLKLAGAEITVEPLPFGHEGTVVRVAGTTWTVHRFAGRHSLARDEAKPHVREAGLGAIQKILAMEFGPAVRRSIGLSLQGYLPNIFALASGVAHVSMGAGMELNWREDGTLCRVVAESGNTVESLHTYRSQYLRHPLNTILASFVEEGPGIFTDEAPGVSRPFELSQQTHNWISARWPATTLTPQSLFYDSPHSGGIRISVVNGGFRVDERDERSSRYAGNRIWAASMNVLEAWLTDQGRDEQRSALGLRERLTVPDSSTIAEGFSIEPVAPNSIDNRPVQLLRNGELQAILVSSYIDDDWFDVKRLSHLIAIGADQLERSFLHASGAPSLELLHRNN
jgi:hypothetical protein